jgi:hypothetical protein
MRRIQPVAQPSQILLVLLGALSRSAPRGFSLYGFLYLGALLKSF